jgi:hypothetical protein
LLTHGTSSDVALRLSSLVAPFGCVSADDHWMPNGFVDTEEAQLDKALRLLDKEVCKQLGAWWLPRDRQHAMTPNFDIASTCSVNGKPGLLLIEAKAHDEELRKEETGRILKKNATDDRIASHSTIGAAIASAASGFQSSTSMACALSRDSRYQMSNRFAWAWKLTELGLPVVLVYLGYLNAGEMKDQGVPFTTHADWEKLVKAHSASLFPADVWGQSWVCNDNSFVPLIRSVEVPLA